MCDSIYIGNTKQTFKKIMDGHFYDLQRLLKNEQKPDSFADHFVHNFNTNTSRTDLCKYMMFIILKQLNPSVEMKKSTKPNCNICMEEHLTILKKIRQMRHGYEQEFGDLWGLPAQNDFPLIFTKH